ncbi:MAG: heme exporter protein CcmB [Actinomycetota bacterium]
MHEIVAVATKDLRIEWRSKVVASQVLPFAVIVLVLFGLALDADRGTLRTFTPGLFWVTVLFVAILAIQRSVAVETASSAFEALRLSGAAGWKVFLGKAMAVAAQLAAIEVVMLLGVIILYRTSVADPMLVVISAVAATIAISTAGSLYGVLAVGMGVRDTILPMLLLPILAPVLVAATRAFDDALNTAAVNGWTWTVMLACFAVLYAIIGSVAYAVVLEDT